MLPDIHIQNGHEFWVAICNQVLVHCGIELKPMLLRVVCKPSPATTLDSSGTLLKSLFKLLKRVPSFQNVSHQLGIVVRTMTVFRSAKTIPEEFVIEVATTVKL